MLLDSFSYIGESGQLHHAPSEGLRLLALLEQHKSGVVVEHPVAVCTCDLRSAVLLVQPGSVAESRIAGSVQHVGGSDKALHRFAAVDDLPCLVLVVHVGVSNAAERVLLVHLHHSLLPVRVRHVQCLQLIESGSDRKQTVLCADVLCGYSVPSLDLGLEDVHVFLNADLGERMEIVAVGNEFLAHSSTSLCERKACESLGECVVHSDAEVDDVGSCVCECELQLRSLNSICEHADTSVRLRFGDVVPYGAVLGHFNGELGCIQIALCKVAERERASELGTDKREASDVVPESCESRVIRSCRSVRREVLRRIFELLVHLLQTVVGCEALRAVPRCGAVGFQPIGLGLEGLVGRGICRSCCKSVDKRRDGVAGYIAGGRIRIGRIHVHRQVACKRLARCESDSGSERSDVVLLKRIVLQMRRIVCVRRVGAGDCNLVASRCSSLVEVRNLRGRNIQRPAADVADTGHLSCIGRSELNCRRRNCRRRTCIVEQLLHLPCEGALCAVVVHDLEVEASTLRKKLLHVERERRLAHVAHSCRRICFCAVAGDGARDSGVAGGCNRSVRGNCEGGLCCNTGPVDDLCGEGAVLLLEVDISGCRHSDVLRRSRGCVEA